MADPAPQAVDPTAAAAEARWARSLQFAIFAGNAAADQMRHCVEELVDLRSFAREKYGRESEQATASENALKALKRQLDDQLRPSYDLRAFVVELSELLVRAGAQLQENIDRVARGAPNRKDTVACLTRVRASLEQWQTRDRVYRTHLADMVMAELDRPGPTVKVTAFANGPTAQTEYNYHFDTKRLESLGRVMGMVIGMCKEYQEDDLAAKQLQLSKAMFSPFGIDGKEEAKAERVLAAQDPPAAAGDLNAKFAEANLNGAADSKQI